MHDDKICYIWSTEIFQLAFQNAPLNPLLDIILGVSALHLQLLDPTDTSIASAASTYFARGLRTCNAMLSQADESWCLLFASSILIALQAVLSRQQLGHGERYVVPIAWFRALRGVNAIASAGRQYITNSKFRPLLLDVSQLPIEVLQHDATFTRLWEALAGITELKHVETYENAFKYLHWVYVLRQRGEEMHSLRRKLLEFPSRISPLFISLLENGDPRTLIITAHFFGLIAFVDQI